MYTCELGAGAFRNGEPLTYHRRRETWPRWPVTRKLYAAQYRSSKAVARVTSTRCIAVDYCALVNNSIHFAHYRGVRAWDHAPGWLLHTEAGGYSGVWTERDIEGKPGETGILLATDLEAWDVLQALIQDAIANFK